MNAHAAKARFSRLVDKATASGEIIIAKAGKPLANVPLTPPHPRPTQRLGIWQAWRIDPNSIQWEFYDYATERGRAELDNTPTDPHAPALQEALLRDIVINELRSPIAPRWRAAQHYSERAYLRYEAVINALTKHELAFRADF